MTPSLTFNTDGTLDPEQLEGLPDELRERLTSPEFQEMARQQIRRAINAEQSTPSKSARFTPVTRGQTIRRNPTTLNRRDFRKASKLARRVMKGSL